MSEADRRRQADHARMRKSETLEGLHITGRVLDRAKPYERQATELKGIADRIKRIESGQEKP